MFAPLSSVYVNISDVDFRYLMDPKHAYSDREFLGKAFFHNPFVSKELKDIGVSIRGSFTRRYLRKSFSLNFVFKSSSQRLVNLKKLGLRALPFDVSYLRDQAVHDLSYYLGIKRPRTGFAQFYLNDVYFGL